MRTLRDIDFKQITNMYFNKSGQQRFAKRNIVFSHDLRQLAIEWIKHLQKQDEEFTGEYYNGFLIQNPDSIVEIINWIKHFF